MGAESNTNDDYIIPHVKWPEWFDKIIWSIVWYFTIYLSFAIFFWGNQFFWLFEPEEQGGAQQAGDPEIQNEKFIQQYRVYRPHVKDFLWANSIQLIGFLSGRAIIDIIFKGGVPVDCVLFG